MLKLKEARRNESDARGEFNVDAEEGHKNKTKGSEILGFIRSTVHEPALKVYSTRRRFPAMKSDWCFSATEPSKAIWAKLYLKSVL